METQGINLNITGRDEHLPKIERFIWRKNKSNSKYIAFQHIAKQTSHCGLI